YREPQGLAMPKASGLDGDGEWGHRSAMQEMTPLSFDELLAVHAGAVEDLLRNLLDERPREGEIARPERLLAAMRHGALNGGKRLRPFLLIESARLFGAQGEAVLRVAAALECVHCYSLIHDDLPAMDDDDLRRGQPTVHRAFDEATAILAGDSLLTYAFDIIADEATALPASTRLEIVLRLARAAGIGGMAGGQALDLEAEKAPPGEEGIVRLQAMKTGALIRFACEAGALACQLADDLLDLTASSETMGKATGKDAAAGKATLAGLHGEDWARKQLEGLITQAEELLEPFGQKADILREAARFVARRQH